MLSNTLEITLRKALSIATEHMHEYATYEHLLLALLDNQDVTYVLDKNKIDINSLEKRLTLYLTHDLQELVNENAKEAKPTAGFQRIIQRAALHSQFSGRRIINGADVLAEFFFEHDAYALLCLKECNLTRQDILNYAGEEEKSVNSQDKSTTQKSVDDIKVAEKPAIKNKDKAENQSKNLESDSSEENGLKQFCVNLNERADADAIDCLIGRQNEIQRVIEILCRRKKNNALLVGEPGVGKTAIAEGLAIRIVKKDVPDILKDSIIYSLDIGNLVAGTKFRGDFEERIKKMLETLRSQKNAILFIDEIHTIIGAGATTSGALDASNLLKPALAKGELRCIGSTTFKEYHNHFEKDMALVRRFQKIVVAEPSEEATMKILQGLKGSYEKHHNVSYSDNALWAAIRLSERYINDRHLPDKAIDLIDEAGSRSKIAGNSSKTTVTINEKDIERLITSIINIPDINVDSDDIKQLQNLEKTLKESIFGQDEAIHSLCASMKLSRAGLKKENRPTGCYMFAGQTGVGKTELAKQLAIACNMELIKLDMSEFAESSSISKLLGSAPGYVGYDQGGMLTEEVDKYPYSVVLFDEIEKANPEIYNLLLQIMDEGTLTDSTGKSVSFSHTVIIMTTNVTTEKATTPIGFSNSNGSKGNKENKGNLNELNEKFSPEFRNRLDKIILFNPIDNIVGKIVDKNIKELAAQLADKKVAITVSSAVKKYLVQTCFDTENGARVLDRLIDVQMKQHIADEILFGKLRNGGKVKVDFSRKDEKITFKYFGASMAASEEVGQPG
jgi:ATP-dependent Clp protease ATP-binding subunit ClpA